MIEAVEHGFGAGWIQLKHRTVADGTVFKSPAILGCAVEVALPIDGQITARVFPSGSAGEAVERGQDLCAGRLNSYG